MSMTIERVVEASPELHDLIGELNDILGAAYETHQRVTAFRSTKCSSLICAYSWRGSTASWWAAAGSRCSTITPTSNACIPGQRHAVGGC